MDDPLIVAVRLGLYVTIGAVFGISLFALYGLPLAGLRVLPLRAIAGFGAGVGLGLSLLGFAALAAGMAATPLAALKADDLRAMIGMEGIGRAWEARTLALAALIALAALVRSRRATAWAGALLGAVALGSLAWNGHGVATEGQFGNVHLVADIAHLLAAGAWLGALGALAIVLGRTREQASDVDAAHRALAGFSVAGTAIVATVVITGLTNSWALVGPDHVLGLTDTLYGRLLLAKLVLFVAMLGLAALNRFHLTPALEGAAHDPRAAIRSLRRSLAFETAAALTILALVAWLGTLMPPGDI
jgi:putative copper resistance protein D